MEDGSIFKLIFISLKKSNNICLKIGKWEKEWVFSKKETNSMCPEYGILINPRYTFIVMGKNKNGPRHCHFVNFWSYDYDYGYVVNAENTKNIYDFETFCLSGSYDEAYERYILEPSIFKLYNINVNGENINFIAYRQDIYHTRGGNNWFSELWSLKYKSIKHPTVEFIKENSRGVFNWSQPCDDLPLDDVVNQWATKNNYTINKI